MKRTHGKSGTHLYKVWVAMVQRCTNPNEKSFRYYGGRGIKVCDKWLRFEGFFDDMGKDWKRGRCIERSDNNGPYDPQNCKWSNRVVQANNTQRTRRFNYRGSLMTIREIIDSSNLNPPLEAYTILHRIRLGWTIEDASETPRCHKGPRGRVNSGSNHGMAKMTEEKVKKVRILSENGIPKSQIASMFSVAPSTIGFIVKRRTWSHI